MGGQVVLLQPEGHLDFEVLSKTISSHQVTYMGTVPSQVAELVAFLQNKNGTNLLETLRCISSGGKRYSYEILTLCDTPRRDSVYSYGD